LLRLPRCAVVVWFVVVFVLPSVVDAHEFVRTELEALDAELARRQDPRLLIRRAELHRVRGETQLALDDLARAQAIAPALETVALARARTLLEAGRAAEAREALAGSRSQARASGAVLLLDARAQAALGRSREAAETYARAVAALSAPAPDVFLEWSNVEVAGGGRAERALAAIDAGIAKLGPAAALEERALELELALGRYDAALARLDALAARSARPVPSSVRRAEILAEAGRPLEAAAALDAAQRQLASESARRGAAREELAWRIARLRAELGTEEAHR
jgi:predicted Zn-dependent protease